MVFILIYIIINYKLIKIKTTCIIIDLFCSYINLNVITKYINIYMNKMIGFKELQLWDVFIIIIISKIQHIK